MVPNPYAGHLKQQVPERVIGPVRHEAILAYRAWSIHRGFGDSENEWTLRSCSICSMPGKENWGPGENKAIHCGTVSTTSGIPAVHEVPLWGCVCGYWAVERFDNVHKTLESSGLIKNAHIYGSVYLWGRIIRHEEGYRAAMAQIAGLLIPEDTNENNIEVLRKIAERYQVPLVSDKRYLGG